MFWCSQENPGDRDAEARVNAVKGLIFVCETLTEDEKLSGYFNGENVVSLFLLIRNEVMNSLFKALDDYSTDNRGDVGSWVREAAMDGLERCTYILCKRDSIEQGKRSVTELNKKDCSDGLTNTYFDSILANKIVGSIIKQAVEKMDKLRDSAARILHRILHNETFVPHIPEREALLRMVPSEANIKLGVRQESKFLVECRLFSLLMYTIFSLYRYHLSLSIALFNYFKLVAIANILCLDWSFLLVDCKIL